jgi:hypothetical protein
VCVLCSVRACASVRSIRDQVATQWNQSEARPENAPSARGNDASGKDTLEFETYDTVYEFFTTRAHMNAHVHAPKHAHPHAHAASHAHTRTHTHARAGHEHFD